MTEHENPTAETAAPPSSSPAEHETGHDSHGEHGGSHDGYGAHVVSTKLLVTNLVVLLILTFITVGVTYLPALGSLNLVIALGIAFLKATLVALFFMHLYWDKPFNSFVLVSSLFFVALFLGFCMMDTREYRPFVDRIAPAVGERIDDATHSSGGSAAGGG